MSEIRLGKVLGEGATAVTYVGEDDKGRGVCVKKYKTSMQAKDKQTIDRELAIIRRIEHPKIPRILDVYSKEEGGRELLHVVFELVDGTDLAQHTEKQQLAPSVVYRILQETLGILVYLHALQPPIIHRDIKTSNIMLRLDGSVVLIDFGQAINQIYQTYGQTMVTGSLGYQSPEQIYGNATSKADVYSVGAVAIELLVHRHPSDMLDGHNLRWEKHCRHFPLPLQEWLDGLLQVDAKRRMSAQEALSGLQKISHCFQDSIQQRDAVGQPTVSAEFLSKLDDAIQDFSHSQRTEREEKHKEQMLKERKEEHWQNTEAELWQEMEGSWLQLCKAIEQQRILEKQGIELFQESFSHKVEGCRRAREWGNLHPKIEMLWTVVTTGCATSEFESWLKSAIFRDMHTKQEELRAMYNTNKMEIALCETKIDQFETEIVQFESKNMVSQLFYRLISWLGVYQEFAYTQIEIVKQKYAILTQEQIGLQQQAQTISTAMEKRFAQYRFFKRYMNMQDMVLVTGGTFEMGALEENGDADDNEKPRHRVSISRDILVGKYPVTQWLYESVMGKNPSKFKGTNRPVECVSWYAAVEFCNKLSVLEGREPVYTINGNNVSCNFGAKGYRLLTEAEWEYCARSGQRFKYAGSDTVDEVAWYSGNSDTVDEVAWYDGNSGGGTHPVGLKKCNGFGLYDMSGNVWEWCWDWYGSYSSASQEDPQGPTSGSDRVRRGGSWGGNARLLRVSSRGYNAPAYTNNNLGFRLGLTP